MIDRRTAGLYFVRGGSLLWNCPAAIQFAARTLLRWLRRHHALLLYRLDQCPNQFFMITCTYHPTPEPTIRTLYMPHGYFQPIPCQFSSLSIEHPSNLDFSCSSRMQWVLSLQLTCFLYLFLQRSVLNTKSRYLESSRLHRTVLHGALICWWLVWTYEGRFPPKMRDHQSSYQTATYHSYAIGTSQIPQQCFSCLDNRNVQTSSFD